MQKAVADTLRDGDALGCQPLIGNGGAGPAKECCDDQNDYGINPPESGTVRVGFLDGEGTVVAVESFYFCQLFFLSSQDSLRRRY